MIPRRTRRDIAKKLQHPNSKHQRSTNLQASNTSPAVLEFGPWNFFGAWMLELGALDPFIAARTVRDMQPLIPFPLPTHHFPHIDTNPPLRSFQEIKHHFGRRAREI